MIEISKRRFVKGLTATAGLALGGCNATNFLDQSFVSSNPSSGNAMAGIDRQVTGSIGSNGVRPAIGVDANLSTAANMYGPLNDGGYSLEELPIDKLPKNVRRQRLPNNVQIAPGSILIDTKAHYAYLGLSDTEVIRYGVGVGKAGFEWQGNAKIGRKAEWPVWTPPAEMIERRPDLEKFRDGMPPGPKNPLGARSLYLFADGRDTLYRLHGTPEWDSIGKSMSSGCIRFLNHDIIDLYQRTSTGTNVRVV